MQRVRVSPLSGASHVAGFVENNSGPTRLGAPTADAGVGIAAIEKSLSALRRAATNVADLAVEATELEERARALARREHDVARKGAELDRAIAEHADADLDLRRREAELAVAARKVAVEAEFVERRQQLVTEALQKLSEHARLLEARESRLHWRWLLRAWRWRPPLPGRAARVCDLLFVPSPSGYKLLTQEGIALRRGARLTGLLDEATAFVVTKIAPWPLDGQWCAYLEQVHPRR